MSVFKIKAKGIFQVIFFFFFEDLLDVVPCEKFAKSSKAVDMKSSVIKQLKENMESNRRNDIIQQNIKLKIED